MILSCMVIMHVGVKLLIKTTKRLKAISGIILL